MPFAHTSNTPTDPCISIIRFSQHHNPLFQTTRTPNNPVVQEYDAYQDYSPPALEAYRAWLRTQVGWRALVPPFALLLLQASAAGLPRDAGSRRPVRGQG